ncbi:MAG TPA: putative PEP-binding protein, partial [Thermomicrobiaceae bacterium]|nr:putative PEP-binding protein [Thermomicrobiaceae bacterium]
VRINLFANIGGLEQAAPALAGGAEGVGLFRTEFLFIDRPEADGLPSEEEQLAAYRQVLEAFAPRPVVVRTLDAGGDKPIPGIERPAEANPFLGVRGLRLTLRYPELLRTQLRALLRAATSGDLWIMFPMVTTIQDVREAHAIVDDVQAELRREGVPHRDDVPLGIMVETPAAALMAGSLAREVDFFSLGTNDLAQYVLAIDRTDDELSQRYSPLEPAVLRLIGETVAAAGDAGKPVAVCGELAGDPAAIPVLLGLGVRELSMTAGSLGRAREIVRSLRISQAEEMVRRRLDG